MNLSSFNTHLELDSSFFFFSSRLIFWRVRRAILCCTAWEICRSFAFMSCSFLKFLRGAEGFVYVGGKLFYLVYQQEILKSHTGRNKWCMGSFYIIYMKKSRWIWRFSPEQSGLEFHCILNGSVRWWWE